MLLEDFNQMASECSLSASSPYDHVAICLALQDMGISTQLYKYSICLNNSKNEKTSFTGLVCAIEENVFSLEGLKGWDDIQDYEVNIACTIYQEMWGKTPKAQFSYEKVDAQLARDVVCDAIDKVAKYMKSKLDISRIKQ